MAVAATISSNNGYKGFVIFEDSDMAQSRNFTS